MAFSAKEFMKDVERMDGDPRYKRLVRNNLPNNGASVKEICSEGMAALKKNSDRILAQMDNT